MAIAFRGEVDCRAGVRSGAGLARGGLFGAGTAGADDKLAAQPLQQFGVRDRRKVSRDASTRGRGSFDRGGATRVGARRVHQ
jgi:hypothetical protein